MKYLLLLLFPLSVFAQNNYQKLKKKDLLLQLAENEYKTDSLNTELAERELELIDAANKLSFLRDSINVLRNQISEYKTANDSMSTLLCRNVEVYDLYSFGYQPYRNDEEQYDFFISEAQNNVVASRMDNIEKLSKLLKSSKIDEAEKLKLFETFQTVYPESMGKIDQKSLEKFDSQAQFLIYQIVERKSAEQLKSSSAENRWIQDLENRIP